METIKIRVTGSQIEVTRCPAVITAGTVGMQVEFTFDSQWDALAKTAVFKAGEKATAAALQDNTITVPWEVLATPNQWLCIGVYGTNVAGTVAIPTLWAKVAVVHTGTDPEADPATKPTPTVWQEVWSGLVEVRNVVTETDGMACDNKAAIEEHTNNLLGPNPHQVTCEQIGAATQEALSELDTWVNSLSSLVIQAEAQTVDNKKAIEEHTENKLGDNPHNVTAAQVGAAPAGYGLGEKAAFAVNWNNGFLNAFTRSKDNSPDGKWWYGLTCRDQSGTYTTTQIAFSVDAGNLVSEARRSRGVSAAWGQWEYVNPPMQPGVEYRTTRRWRGRPVYTQLLIGGQAADGQGIDFTEGLIVEMVGWIMRNDEPWYYLPYGQKAWLECESYTGVTLHCDNTLYLDENNTLAVQVWYII